MNSQSYPSCDQLHQKAMDAANLAVELQRKGDQQAALQQFQIAFSWEKQAAMLLSFNMDAEPSRSILFRSAAFLAIKAEQYLEAERMAAFGLIGNPPADIADELRTAMDQVFPHLKIAA